MTNQSIGSFRDGGDILSADSLPADLASLRVVEANLETQYPLQSDVAHLNHGAFGAVTESMMQLETALRRRAHNNPSHFYDHLCLPLLRETLVEATKFFNGPVILQPNCTIAMKAVLQTLVASTTTVARLAPIYGATSKLLGHLFPDHITVDPGVFSEDSLEIVQHLDSAYARQPFDVLVADHVSSQSGRVLPLRAVVEWCRAKKVVSVVDGTQASWFENAVWPDYYVLSTHKWLGNIKTCAVVRIEDGAAVPEPVGISFGHPDPIDRHLWTGMLDYVPYILLAKALRVYRRHGREMLRLSANVLAEGMRTIGVAPVLSCEGGGDLSAQLAAGEHPRTMCLLRVHRLEADLQGALERYGVCVSVKSLLGQTYLRISGWVYNTAQDFCVLRDFLQYRIPLNGGLGSSAEVRSARKRMQIMQGVEQQMDMEEQLFSRMTVDAFFHRAEVLRHPLIFYYGHTAVFFMNKLLLGMHLAFEDKIDPELETLCAVGVDEMSWDDLALGAWDKTPADQRLSQFKRVQRYRRQVLELLRGMILDPARELVLPITTDSIWWVFCMGIEHSRIHVETSSVIMAQLPLHLLATPPAPHATSTSTVDAWKICHAPAVLRSDAPVNSLVKVSGGTVRAGRALKGTRLFGWDNEFGKGKETKLSDFEISQMLVSNAEYADFIDAGGFDRREFWSEDGWSWAQDKDRPRFWLQEGAGAARLRTLTEERDMPYSWPATCNHYEAEAFCAWKSSVLGRRVRLISHPEWLLLAERSASNDYNLNLQRGGSACPVDTFSEPLGQDGKTRVYDVRGNLWQHSRSLLTVLPEFAPHPLYDDFTLPTIDGAHSFLVGGSWTSVGNCAEIAARYGFRRHFYQFAGIRYVCSDNEDLDAPKRLVHGEAALALAENYLDFTDAVHLNVQPVPNAMVVFGAFAARQVKRGDAVLVLNGSVGRLTIEISLHSSPASILHTDATANSLDAFLYFKDNASIRFERPIEGKICKTEEAMMPPEWSRALCSTEVKVKQIDIFRLACDVVEPRDVVVVDLVQLNKAGGSCPRRGLIPPNLHVLVKHGGTLVLQHSVADGSSDAPPLIPGFVVTEERSQYYHISQESRRNYRFSNTHCHVYQRLEGQTQMELEAEQEEVSELAEVLKYERNDEIATYTKFHFGDRVVYGMPNFPTVCAKICVEACGRHNVSLQAALEAGCGPGRLAIELADIFQRVTAFDYSTKLLAPAQARQPANMTVFQADAHTVHNHPVIAAEGKKFDLIVGANLMDRMSKPGEFIQTCKLLLAEHGLLVLFSPFCWMKEFTAEERWLGGYRADAEVVWSLQGVVRQAGPELCVCEPPIHVPFAIPQPDNTVCYVYSQCLVFGRRGQVKQSSLVDVIYSSMSC